MDLIELTNKTCNKFGDNIKLLVEKIYNIDNHKNILFVRTCTTGDWLDNLLTNIKNIDRILYYTDKVNKPVKTHKTTKKIHSNNLSSHLESLNKKFDLICVDTFHEYEMSLRDFQILSSLLSDSGILISHDCCPWNKTVANPFFIPGSWCGETYIAFVKFAYDNPQMFYSILNTDTGIGIISKIQLPYLSNVFDKQKQELAMDFIIERTASETHVLNAVSPAFTSSISVSRHLVASGS
jgi:hypothetical protein